MAAPHHDLPPYSAQPARFGAFGWLLVALMTAAVAIPMTLALVAPRAPAPPQTTAGCPAPTRDGDRVLITVRHAGGHLVTTCQPLTDWRSPERKP